MSTESLPSESPSPSHTPSNDDSNGDGEVVLLLGLMIYFLVILGWIVLGCISIGCIIGCIILLIGKLKKLRINHTFTLLCVYISL